MKKLFLTRVVLKNYKSIASCDVKLHQLSFFVGLNGAGKSNFLDALRFVSDSLSRSLDHALRERGGIKDVRRRSSGHPTHFGIRLEFSLANGSSGHYAFRLGALKQGGYEVQTEECLVQGSDFGAESFYYRVENGKVRKANFENQPPVASSDRLYLVTVSGYPPFREVFQSLSNMGFYSLNPEKIRDLQSPDMGDILLRDGSNIASVIAKMESTNSVNKIRIEEYLKLVVPGIHGINAKEIGPKETLEFRQAVAGSKEPWRFLASNMSDGTLRALGVLVALFQNSANVPLVAVEEPEVALHPAAAGVLFDSLLDASNQRQVIVTSHSPDLLDNPNIDVDAIFSVTAKEGVTYISQIDNASRSSLKDHLYTAGELLRINQLEPDIDSLSSQARSQMNLFDRDS